MMVDSSQNIDQFSAGGCLALNYLNRLYSIHGGIVCGAPADKNDLAVINSLAENLQYIADLAGADVFIDVLTSDRDVAEVIAEAKPRTARSLYSKSVLGQPARRENEPAVFQTFASGKPSINVRGISQEGVPIAQTVQPVFGRSGQVVAVLIMERDNTEQVQQEDSLKVLSETTQKLTDTLLNLSSMGEVLPTLLHDALLITNDRGEVSFANKVAEELFEQLTGEALKSTTISRIVKKLPQFETIFGKDIDAEEFVLNGQTLLVRSLSVRDKFGVVGKVYLLRDITELRRKEKQLIAKSAVIKEIHHRVKNNLQTIASLMRLQMRRVDEPEVKHAFQESINRIKCIAMVHEFFSKESPEIIEMKSCIVRITDMLKDSMIGPTQSIEVEVGGEKVYLPSEQATPVAIVTNELLQNALEHGFAGLDRGVIRVGITVMKEDVEIIIDDNGIGLPGDFNLGADANLGLQIAQTLVEESLGGILQLLPKHAGTRAIVKFPFEGR
ncbi:MAG: sensor histidine kinase [Bacillota bacterium]